MRFTLSLLVVLSASTLVGCKKNCTLTPCPSGGFDFSACRCVGLDGGLPGPPDGSVDALDAGALDEDGE